MVETRIDRVMVSKDQAVSPKRAEAEFGIKPDLAFVRNDGWTLGAPLHLAEAAYDTWPDQWEMLTVINSFSFGALPENVKARVATCDPGWFERWLTKMRLVL